MNASKVPNIDEKWFFVPVITVTSHAHFVTLYSSSDINECLDIHNTVCSHLGVNTNGSFRYMWCYWHKYVGPRSFEGSKREQTNTHTCPEASNFRLMIGGYDSSRSNLSDWLTAQDSFPFSMKDRSNMNGGKSASCSTDSIQDGGSGNWWFGTCFIINLNNNYKATAEVACLTWLRRVQLWRWYGPSPN